MGLTDRVRRLLSAVVLALTVVFGVLAFAGPASALPVTVQGNVRVSADTIGAYFTGTDQASIDRGVADLLATGMFTKVAAKVVNGQIVVTVVEGKIIINRVAFEGNRLLKSDQLEVEVQSKPRQAYDEKVAQGDIDRIKEAYKKVGRGEIQVSYRTVPLPNGRVDLVFKIDEGEKTGVREIKFVGNQVYSAYRLKGLMQLTEMNFLSWVKTSDVYDPDRLASDEEEIRKFYMKNGYADFRITNTDVSFQENPPGYVITISVDEGPQYHVSSVNVVSHLARVDSASLTPFLKIAAGDVYNATAIDQTTTAITRELARQGYAFSDVRASGQRDNAAHQIAVTFIADDGPKVYIERIDIVGNTRTRDYVIRREFDIGEGDPYNHAMIEAAERRLNNLGYFKKVHISTRPGSAPDRVIVTVEVEDQPTGSISISGGYSTTAGWLAEVAFTETNFLGRGQYLRLSASDGQYSRGWGVSFTEPYFLGQHIAAGIDIYHNVQNQNTFQLYNYWVTGVTLRAGFPITEQFTIQPIYSIYGSQVSIPNTPSQPYDACSNPIVGTTPGTAGAPPISATVNCLTEGQASIAAKEVASLGQRIISSVGYSLIYDSLDAHKNTTSGVYATFRQDIAGAGGDAHYVRETFDGKYYYPLTDDLTGLIHLQGGQINGFGGRPLLITDNFNLGPTLVRGFAPGGLGPRDISDPDNIAGNPLGGTTYAGASAELQFPIFGLPREIGLRGAIFGDAGTLFGYHGQTNFATLFGLPAGSPCTSNNPMPNASGTLVPTTQSSCLQVYDDHKIRTSLGASVLWDSPIGPIRFDYAIPVTRAKYDQTQYFSFSGGATF